jgi:hypothetical protein
MSVAYYKPKSPKLRSWIGKIIRPERRHAAREARRCWLAGRKQYGMDGRNAGCYTRDMQVTYRFHNPIAKRIALSLLLAVSAAAWQGCLMDPASGPESQSPAADPGAGAKTLQETPPIPADGVPRGCSRQWSSTAHDSVLYCPDPRPPKPEKNHTSVPGDSGTI